MEIYVAVDVGTDGPVPGTNSMLSLGSAAYRADKTLVSTFSANLDLLPGAVANPATLRWWMTEPGAWAESRYDPEPPLAVMRRYDTWLAELPGKPVFVAYPLTFDWGFVSWYLERFVGTNRFGLQGIDIRSYAMGIMRSKGFDDSQADHWPERWFSDNLPYDHTALHDALAQGAVFCNILAEANQP